MVVDWGREVDLWMFELSSVTVGIENHGRGRGKGGRERETDDTVEGKQVGSTADGLAGEKDTSREGAEKAGPGACRAHA